VLGDALETLLKDIIDVLLDISEQSLKAGNTGGPILSLQGKAPGWINTLNSLNTALIKSKYNYTA
jgi:hypothetical protein